jgi:hypothetical protein
MQKEIDNLRLLLAQHDAHWQAIGAALGVTCGGVDVPVDTPGGNAAVIIAATRGKQ